MQRPSHLAGLALAIESIGNGQCLRVDLEYCSKCGASAIQRLDSIDVLLRYGPRRQPSRRHRRLEIRESRFLERERRD